MQRNGPTVTPQLPALAALVIGVGCTEPARPPTVTTIDVSPATPILHEFGDTVRLTAIVKDQHGEVMPSVPVAWSSTENFIVHLTEDGLVTATEPGRVPVRASVETVTGTAVVQVQPGQRTVLHKLYRVMGGDDWIRNDYWKSALPLNRWVGVTTDAQGRILALWLPNNGLAGEIPDEVGSLTDLVTLSLQGNRATGPIPPEFGNLRNLQFLNLRSNQLSGEIPPELGSLQSLQTLNLGFNRLTGSIPAGLGEIQSLRSLYVDSNQLDGEVPGELGNIPQLVVMNIADNPLSGLLPRDLVKLPLAVFYWYNTDLCAPVDIAFQDWLNGIADNRGNRNC